MNKLKFLLFKYSIKRFVPLTSGAPRKRLSKPVLLIFGIALVFAIMGFIDLKVNAAENQYLTLYYEFGVREDNSGVYNGWKYADWNGVQRTAVLDNSYSYALLRSDYSQGGVQCGYTYTLYSGQIGGTYSSASVSTTNNVSSIPLKDYVKGGEDTIYSYTSVPTSLNYWNTVLYPDLIPSTYYSYTYISHDTNLPIFTSTQGLADYYATGNLNGQYIDYNSLEIDNDMPTPQGFKLNQIANDTDSGEKTYDYITWDNTSDLSIQVRVCPVVQQYENRLAGFQYGEWLIDFFGEFTVNELLSGNTNSYTFQTWRDSYLGNAQNYPNQEFIDFYTEYFEQYGNGYAGKYKLLFACGYQFRYVDIANKRASAWVVVYPSKTPTDTITYEKNGNGETTEEEDATGTKNIYSGNLEDIKEDINKENEFRNENIVLDTDTDVTTITNWMKTVVDFIKSTPSLIGSVVSFLPAPITNAFYMIIFLGAFATVIGIVKALI